MRNLNDLSTAELEELRENWLSFVNQVSPVTGALIIQRLGEIETILESRN